MTKILFVENMDLKNDNSMSTCYNLKCLSIKNDSRFHFYDLGEMEEINTDEFSTVVFGCRALYLYKVYKGITKTNIMNKNINLCKIKNKYFIIQDMHRKTYGDINILCKFLKDNDFNIIFTFYHNTEANHIRNKVRNGKYFHLPHYIDTSIFKHMNLEKKYDILLFGAIHPAHYPFRKRLFELILKNEQLFNVRFIPKPEVFDPTICENGLAELINMSKICIATKSRYDYLVGKYFEISMCKSLIAGDIPTDGINIFKDRIIELDNKMTDNEIIEKLKNGLDQYDKYSKEIDFLSEHIGQNYGLNKYADKLYDIVNKN